MINSLLFFIFLCLIIAVLYYAFTTLFSMTKKTYWPEKNNLLVVQKKNNSNHHIYYVTRKALPNALETLGLDINKNSAWHISVTGFNSTVTKYKESVSILRDGANHEFFIVPPEVISSADYSIEAPRRYAGNKYYLAGLG